jgi:hypothetical protein
MGQAAPGKAVHAAEEISSGVHILPTFQYGYTISVCRYARRLLL